jgi:hypothetical protein
MANPYLYAVDLPNHAIAWKVTNSFRGSPAVANSAVHVISGNLVKAHSFADGALLGSYNAGSDSGLSGLYHHRRRSSFRPLPQPRLTRVFSWSDVAGR